MRSVWLFPVAAVSAALALVCPARGGEPAPVSEASVEALLFDVQRIVESREASGWLVDELALSDIRAGMMASVCRALPEVRGAALERAEAESLSVGDLRTVYAEEGEQVTSRVAVALSAQRRAAALRAAVGASAAQCPFWLRPDVEFRGLQGTRDRWVFNVDTGGLVQLRRTEGTWTLGAGGSGRLLVGYSFNRLSLMAGVEFGGGALLASSSSTKQFQINYLPALPVVVRLHDDAWHYDLEVTPVALFQADRTQLSYGARAAFTIGVSALRVRGVLPWVGVGVAAEYYFHNQSRAAATYLRGGLRVGGVWAP